VCSLIAPMYLEQRVLAVPRHIVSVEYCLPAPPLRKAHERNYTETATR